MREAMASETPEQREVRLDHLRRYMKQVRDSETPEQREVRLTDNRDKMRRVRARKKRETMTIQQQQAQHNTGNTQRTRASGGAGQGATRRNRRNVQRTWETLEEAAKRLLGDRWKYLETLMAERKSGISVAEASDMFQDEIKQGLIHVCCLCNRLLFQKSEVQLPEVKLEDTAADGFLPDHTSQSLKIQPGHPVSFN
ncbi:unnamed protein product [Pleuronectes platessa]|uniref:STPR domain-containing protein n=1 Tax=Pleuronectes platessa TaxID=8262 RepID=A0A9N7UPH4_PLEPL|nr:unnamed protein product [Pleuronectes platessa]